MKTLRLLFLFTALTVGMSSAAEPPGILNHQGRINVDGTAFDGAASFKFALVDAAGTTSFWSNDGTSVAAAEPSAAVPLTVSGGRYSVALGDTSLANMSAAIPTSVFADNAAVYLRIWFDDGSNGSQLLSPDQRLGAVGYALAAGSAVTADSVDAANVTGTLAAGQLPAEVLLDGASGVSLSGTFDGTVTGDGSGLTSLDSASLTGILTVDETPSLRNVGHIDSPGGGAYDVAVSGNFAYVAHSIGGLRIYDITDPASPVATGHIDNGGVAMSVAVSGDYAFLANLDDGLRIYDVTDPANPVNVGHIDDGDNALGVAVSGNYAYLANTTGGLRIYDITDPAAPVNVGHIDDGGSAQDVAVSGGYAYLANGTDGLRVYDVTDPSNPLNLRQVAVTGQALGVTVSGDQLYLVDFDNGFGIYDITDPATPVNIGNVGNVERARAVAVSGAFAYLATDSNGLGVYNVTDPANPVKVGHVDNGGRARAVAVSAEFAYLANDSDGLRVYYLSGSVSAPNFIGDFIGDGSGLTGIDAANVSGTLASGQLPAEVLLDGASGVSLSGTFDGDGSGLTGLDSASLTGILTVDENPLLRNVGRIDSPGGGAYDVAVSGNFAYVAYSIGGLRIYDVTNPASPVPTGHIDNGGVAVSVAVSGDYAFLANSDDGLRIYDITDPANPVNVSRIDNGDSARRVAVSGNYAYLANSDGGLRIYDITDPAAPVNVGHIDDGGRAQDVAVSGGYAYLANGTDGLRVYDVTDPSNPVNLSQVNVTGQAAGVAVSGDQLYLVDFEDGLGIYDITDPATPVNIGNVGNVKPATAVTVSGAFAYLPIDTNGLRVYDVTDPANPINVGHVDNGGRAKAVAVSAEFAYLANDSDGLRVYDLSGSVSAPNFLGDFIGDGSGLSGIDLGAQTVTQALDLGGNDLTGAGTVTATAFVGDGSGLTNVPGDNLGNHTATQGLNLNGNFLSGDGDAEGVFVGATGNVGIGIDEPAAPLEVGGNIRLNAADPDIIFYDNTGTAGARRSSIETVFRGIVNNPPYTAADQEMRFNVSNNTGTQVRQVMTLLGDGNVGIGTATPQAPLDVAASGDGADVLRLSTERPWTFQQENSDSAANLRLRNTTGFNKQFSIDTEGKTNFRTQDGSTTVMTVDHGNGRVGIGTSTPTRGKLDIQGQSGSATLSYGYLNSAGNTGTGSGTISYSIYATNRIAAQEFRAHSDQRIKEVQGVSNADEDLQTLMGIEVADYTLRDTVAHGKAPQKKVIAQQVAEVYPQAVSSNLTEVVPDLYQRAGMENGWVNLATDLQPGEKVKLISAAHSSVYEVLAVREGAFQVDWAHEGEVFVYGREVDDFHTVDYEAIAMLNVSATQEQQRLIDKQQAEIVSLRGEIESLKQLVSTLATESKNAESKPVVSR